ncbi:hypothetical protein D3C73_1551360 [compost metagenome]
MLPTRYTDERSSFFCTLNVTVPFAFITGLFSNWLVTLISLSTVQFSYLASSFMIPSAASDPTFNSFVDSLKVTPANPFVTASGTGNFSPRSPV